MSFPAIEVLDQYRGLPGLSRRERPFILLGPAMHRSRMMEFMLLRVAEWDLEPPTFWDLRKPIEAMMEAREQ